MARKRFHGLKITIDQDDDCGARVEASITNKKQMATVYSSIVRFFIQNDLVADFASFLEANAETLLQEIIAGGPASEMTEIAEIDEETAEKLRKIFEEATKEEEETKPCPHTLN